MNYIVLGFVIAICAISNGAALEGEVDLYEEPMDSKRISVWYGPSTERPTVEKVPQYPHATPESIIHGPSKTRSSEYPYTPEPSKHSNNNIQRIRYFLRRRDVSPISTEAQTRNSIKPLMSILSDSILQNILKECFTERLNYLSSSTNY